MNTKVVFFMKPDSFKGKLMKLFTGCYSYHCGFLMEDTQKFYDMFWMRRRRDWTDVLDKLEHSQSVFKIVDSPVDIPESYLVRKILDGNIYYGVIDYVLFGTRWAFHLVGKTTRNAKGLICSEMVANDLKENNWSVTYKEVPSPCDLIRALGNLHCKYRFAFGGKVSENTVLKFNALDGRKEG